jgi:hypothetical protein
MTHEPAADRLTAIVTRLLRASTREGDGIREREELAASLVEIGRELKRLAADPRLSAGAACTADAAGTPPPLADLLREVGAALGTPIDEEADTETLAARLDALLAGFTGDRAPEEDEMQARIRTSAERAIAESLRKRGITALGSSEP